MAWTGKFNILGDLEMNTVMVIVMGMRKMNVEM
jgi:hypothetical protein